jgi:hypothetical protein
LCASCTRPTSPRPPHLEFYIPQFPRHRLLLPSVPPFHQGVQHHINTVLT